MLLFRVAPLSAVVLGMGKREKREGDRRYPNPLYQIIWLLSVCGWISLLSPLPFSIWYYITGHGLNNVSKQNARHRSPRFVVRKAVLEVE